MENNIKQRPALERECNELKEKYLALEEECDALKQEREMIKNKYLALEEECDALKKKNSQSEIIPPPSIGVQAFPSLHDLTDYLQFVRGADLNKIKSLLNQSPSVVDVDMLFQAASRLGKLDIVEYLHTARRVNICYDDNYAIRWAAYNGHAQVVEYLRTHGAYIQANNDEIIRDILNGNISDKTDEILRIYAATLGAECKPVFDAALMNAVKAKKYRAADLFHMRGAILQSSPDEIFEKYSKRFHVSGANLQSPPDEIFEKYSKSHVV